MRMRSVTSQWTRAISSLPAARTSAAWNCSSCRPTRARIGESLGRRHEPDRLQRLELGRGVGARAQAGDARQLEDDAQVVELLEAAEVDRQHVPAELRLDAEKALVAQAKQRLAHRRAADAEALAELGLGEAVAGDELEVVDLRLERVVDDARRACRRAARAKVPLSPSAALIARAGSRAPRRRASRRRSGPRSGSAGRWPDCRRAGTRSSRSRSRGRRS